MNNINITNNMDNMDNTDNVDNVDKQIIYEHISPDMILLELTEILNSEKSKKIIHTPLYWYLKNIVLKNKIVVKNLIQTDKTFQMIYEQHIIKGEKNFIHTLDPIESMAQSWLMYLYH
jgi:hypothetical protein